MAESGGTTTQLGICYQNSVAALYLGRLCASEAYPDHDQPEEVRVEAPDYVDDIVIRYLDGHHDWIQVKGSLHRATKEWNGLWQAFDKQFWYARFNRGSDNLVLVVGETTETFRKLNELCKRAKGATDFAEWQGGLNKIHRDLIGDTTPRLDPNHQSDIDMLAFFQAIRVEIWPIEEIERDRVPLWIPQSSVTQHTLFALLRDIAGEHGTNRKPFHPAALIQQLNKRHSIVIERSPDLASMLEAVKGCGDVLRLHRQIISNTTIHIDRSEVDEIIEWAKTADDDKNLGVILDQAGMGKTVVVCDVLKQLEAEGIVVLAIKADQQLTNISSPDELKSRLGMPDNLDRVVRRLARISPVVVLIDQIDALSLSMARDQATLDLTLSTLARFRSTPNVRILVSCRIFDLHNDPKLRQLGFAREFRLSPFAEADVERVLQDIGCDYQRLSQTARSLLRTPLHLDIFARAFTGQDVDGSYHEIESMQDLYRLLWSNVVMCSTPGAPANADRKAALLWIAQRMYASQQTTVTGDIFADTEVEHLLPAARYLASNGILTSDVGGWSYFHQTFFDFCYAIYFVETEGDLSKVILESDQGLTIRPQMVQILSYLRGSDTREYRKQLQWLMNAALRPHLRDLLLRWFGALTKPTEDEWTIARRIFASPQMPRHLLRAMRGNPDWFARLSPQQLPKLLKQQDAVVDGEVLPYLSSLMESAQPQVVQQLRPYAGVSDVWDNRIARVLATERTGYCQEAVELFAAIFPKQLAGRSQLLYKMELVVAVSPSTGMQLIRTYIDYHIDQCTAPEPGSEDPDKSSRGHAMRDLYDHLGVEELRSPLETLAKDHPALFIESLLPCLKRLIILSGEPIEDRPWYRSDRLSSGWYNDMHWFEGRFPWLFIDAFKAAAEQPEVIRQAVSELRTLPYRTSHQLIAHAYRLTPWCFAQEALRYLLEDRRRLTLGDGAAFETRQLIKAIYPCLPRSEQKQLERYLLSYAPIWRRAVEGLSSLHWRGIEQLNLLRAIPRKDLTGEGERRLREWERKFPDYVTAESAQTVHGGFVVSPIDHVDKLSDRDWLGAMHAYHGPRALTRDLRKGGAYQLSGALEQRVKAEPERFYHLAVSRVPLTVDGHYTRAFLNGLTESNAPLRMVSEVIRRFAPVADDDVKCVICWNLRKRYSEGLPNDLIDLIESYVREPPGVYEAQWMASDSNEKEKRKEVDHVCINTVRGSALEVLTAALDEQNTEEARERQWGILEYVASDPSLPLRSGGIHALIYKLHEDPERVYSLFERMIEGHSALLQSRHTQQFLHHGLARFGGRLLPMLHLILALPDEQDQQRGAELITLLGMHDERQAQHEADRLRAGTPSWRRGCAQVYAHNVNTANADFCYHNMLLLLNDDDEAVRTNLSHFLSEIGDEEVITRRPFLEAYIASRSLHNGFNKLIEYLRDKALIDLDWTLTAVSQILENSFEPETPLWYRDNEGLVRIVVQIYTHDLDESIRRRAMDAFDDLVTQYEEPDNEVLSEFDRR